MAIAKKPPRHLSDIKSEQPDEQAVEAFIAGAGRGETQKPATATAPEPAKLVPVVVRFPKSLLVRIDAAAKKRAVNRTAWILYVVSRALEEEGL
jgi:hypothetical protein